MFIAALTMGNIWKPPECPAIGEWMKMWYIICSEILAVKRKIFCDFSVTAWKVLEVIALSEISQKEKWSDFNLYVESKKQQMKKGKQQRQRRNGDCRKW